MKPINSSPIKHQILRGLGWALLVAVILFVVAQVVVAIAAYRAFSSEG